MREKKKFIILVSGISIIVVIILVSLLVLLSSNSKPAGNQNVEVPGSSNTVNNEVPVNQPTNETTNQITNPIGNEQNQIIVDPILNPSTGGAVQPNITESFALTYYYNQLDDTAKTIYNGLKTSKENLVSGNFVIEYGTAFNTLLNTQDGEKKLNEAFQAAWDAFTYDNVDLFYIDSSKMILTSEYQEIGGIRTYKVYIGAAENSNYFSEEFATKEQVVTAKNYVEDIKRQMTEQISTDGLYRKIGKAHNWLIETISYQNTEGSRNQHTIYGALADNKAVCEGYARTFKYLMDGVGVPCILVSGEGTNSKGEKERHAWNYVQINENWYAIDVTWDDPIIEGGGELPQELKYRYFLKGSDEFAKDHRADGRISENGKTFRFPTLSTQNYRPN